MMAEPQEHSRWEAFPRLLGILDVVPLSGSPETYRFAVTWAGEGECTFLVECGAGEFPFERFCRFVRHRGAAAPYTFPNMEFHDNPPGIRLGPWPGWRGIPEFPHLTASCGTCIVRLQPAFWGDEMSRGIVRFFGSMARSEAAISAEAGEIILTSGDPRIVPRRVSVYRTRRIKSRPRETALLPSLIHVHPRLLVTPGTLPLLRARASGSHRHLWEKLLQARDNWDLPFARTPESKCVEGPERLSPEDRVLVSALTALVTEEKGDITLALEAYSAYVDLTGRPDFEPLGIDTQAGETLFVLCTGYDWLHGWMPEALREQAWERLRHVARICAAFLPAGRNDYGQAHYLGCGLGLLAFLFLAADTDAHDPVRLAELRGAVDCALDLLPKDGSYPHGINLWIYEFGFLLRWIELFRGCAGDNLWASAGEALQHASRFRAATLSRDATLGITFGDPQYHVGGDTWCHYLLASRTSSGLAQWLGERLLDLPHEGVDFRHVPVRRRVYEFLFFDSSIRPEPPTAGAQFFLDIGQVTVRSGEMLFTMRSGPLLGTERYGAGEYGAYGHSDPASGAFLLEYRGDFIACGPGPVYRRDTALHNVVTIDGRGQVGDSTVWLPDFYPPHLLAAPPVLGVAGDSIRISADLAKAYLPHLGVDRCTRALCVAPDRFVLGADEVSCRERRWIDWNAHSRLPFTGGREGGSLVFELGSHVRLAMLAPADAVHESGPAEFIPAYPHDGARGHRCVVSVQSSSARFIWCYLLAGQPVPLLVYARGEVSVVEFADGLKMEFNGQWNVRGREA